MQIVLRALAVVLAGLFVWTLPGLLATVGAAGTLETVFLVVAAAGGILMTPLFLYYAIRGPGAADRLMARWGIRRKGRAERSG